MQAIQTVRIRCGGCGRILHTVTERNYLSRPQTRRPVTAIRADAIQPADDLMLAEVADELSIELPPGTRAFTTTTVGGAGMKYKCHRPCRRTYAIKFHRYGRAVEAALNANRNEVRLGIDIDC